MALKHTVFCTIGIIPSCFHYTLMFAVVSIKPTHILGSKIFLQLTINNGRNSRSF